MRTPGNRRLTDPHALRMGFIMEPCVAEQARLREDVATMAETDMGNFHIWTVPAPNRVTVNGKRRPRKTRFLSFGAYRTGASEGFLCIFRFPVNDDLVQISLSGCWPQSC